MNLVRRGPQPQDGGRERPGRGGPADLRSCMLGGRNKGCAPVCTRGLAHHTPCGSRVGLGVPALEQEPRVSAEMRCRFLTQEGLPGQEWVGLGKGSGCLPGASGVWVVGGVNRQIGCTFALRGSPGGRGRRGSLQPACLPAVLWALPQGTTAPLGVSTFPSSTSNAGQASPELITDLFLGGESVH